MVWSRCWSTRETYSLYGTRAKWFSIAETIRLSLGRGCSSPSLALRSDDNVNVAWTRKYLDLARCPGASCQKTSSIIFQEASGLCNMAI